MIKMHHMAATTGENVLDAIGRVRQAVHYSKGTSPRAV